MKRSTSPAKLASNRQNAQKSTGPRTPDGKAAAAMNRLEHGLRAEQLILPGESAQEYQRFHSQLLHDLAPADQLQLLLAEHVIEAAWKLRRLGLAEHAMLNQLLTLDVAGQLQEKLTQRPLAPADKLGLNLALAEQSPLAIRPMQRYEAALRGQFYQALERFQRVRRENQTADDSL